MHQDHLRALLESVKSGSTDINAAMERLKDLPYEDLGFAKVDHHRAIRVGQPEVIFGRGKSTEQTLLIFEKLMARNPNVLATRVSAETARAVAALAPDAEFFSASGLLRLWRKREITSKGKLLVVSAGTTDLFVAEEAFRVAETFGNEVELIQDVGVAGLHRLLAQREKLTSAKVIVACAGMEAALPTAIGGLVACPVVGVPTSVGYGAHYQGLAAMLGMLNSCASNVTVVNIDNGFGGAYVASLINHL
jgi:pyridinium-3,5-biscarboxylic acid mononucleotide synthase